MKLVIEVSAMDAESCMMRMEIPEYAQDAERRKRFENGRRNH